MSSVRTRHVFFFAGFDPKGPGHYHALYASNAALQSRVSGFAPTVGRRRNDAASHSAQWDVDADDEGSPVRTTIEMLRWDDMARAHWQRHAVPALLATARTGATLIARGAVARMFSMSRQPVYAAFMPLMLAALGLVVALLAGLALAALAARLHAPQGLLLAGGVALTVGLFLSAVHAIHRGQMSWFMQLAAFMLALAQGRVPTLEARIARFADRIVQVVSASRADEVLIVGHSVGANVAVMALARALAADPELARRGPTLSLLTLGHAMPVTSTLPEADGFRNDLTAVAQADIDWVDVSSPIDWAAFALVDPLAGFRDAVDTTGWHPRLTSPRFHRLFTAEGYARLRRQRFRVHLQYLLAAELPGMYDYFAITAGRQTLRQRFESEPAADAR